MDLDSIQTASRRSSRKRAQIKDVLELDLSEHLIQSEPRVVPTQKRRAVEDPDTGTPSRAPRGRRNTIQESNLSSTKGTSIPTSRLQHLSLASTLSHEDPVPSDCCFVCRRRGGNYAYTCVYENGSVACKRCIKEKYKCRPATVEEVAKAEARCPQCKRRGLTNCWYENGMTSCQPCIKWGKQCGAPTRRKFNTHTRSFLGIPTPEPEQRSAAPHEQPLTSRIEQIEITSQTSTRTQRPSQTRMTTGQNITTNISSREDNESETASTEFEQPQIATPSLAYHVSPCKARTETRFSRAVDNPSKRYSDARAVGHGASQTASAIVRGSRRSRQDRGPAPLLVVQGPTPDDSAEELASFSADVDMVEDELADLQLIMENNNAAPRPSFETTAVVAQDENVIQAARLEHDSSDNESLGGRRKRAAVEDAQTLRPRRSHARPSYVERALSEGPDRRNENNDDNDNDDNNDDDDAWDPPTAEDESEVEDEDEELGVVAESSSEEGEDFEDLDSVDIEPQPVTASRRKSQVNTPKQGKGIDLSLPPLDNILDIAADMASKAVDLGLAYALQRMGGRSINVATMCSGTESPLLFLNLLADALNSLNGTPLNVKHHFSAEIDATKQAYIERNFHPPILFRDVRQLGDATATTATTAYGAEESIPGNMDILIAGFVCKDLSALNSKKKSVDDQGETGDTWRAIYFYAKRFAPGIVLLENVKSDKSLWDDVVSRWSRIGYEAAWTYCDTKNYYLPQTRERMYMIAVNRKLHGKGVSEAVAQWRCSMEKLQRQCSSPYEAFLVNLPISAVDHSTLSSEPDWSLCKLRYDQIRSEQRLGTRRPITQWNESGTLNPPDYANLKWYDSQSSRVYDAIDVAHLQAAQEGHDSQYKMKIWDVSQNVDRFKTGMGLMPCITPGGCDFASNRQDALSGSQTLVLQGMPLDKLHFAGETQRERQDLAGNAMSTTVIGASLISAILHGHKAFRRSGPLDVLISESQAKAKVENRLFKANAMTRHVCSDTKPENVDMARFLFEAKHSSRLCACEGEHQLSDMSIKICSDCGHTACSACASNPRHRYVDTVPRHVRKQTPDEFVRFWEPLLPPRLKLQKFPNLDKRLSQLQENRNSDEAYVRRVIEVDVGSQQFNIHQFVRCDNGWRIIYVGHNARMVLSVGDKVQWLLFVDCPPELPSCSELRKALHNPIARAVVNDSILEAEWEMFIPSNQEHSLRLQGSAERSKSWRNLLGLPDHQAETVPAHIHIHGHNDETNILEGEYTHLPHCGTAEASLYKRATSPILYLFLDPNPIGETRDDSFVFSVDCSKHRWGDSRLIVARLHSAWRPYNMSDMNEQHIVDVVRTGSWMALSTKMISVPLDTTVSVLVPGTLIDMKDKCTHALSVLDACIPEELRVENFPDSSWVLKQVKTAPSLEDWQPTYVDAHSICECAPAYPDLMWSVDGAGKATPHEDRKAAATFERGVKSRCPIFHTESTVSKNSTRVQVGVNTSSLVHRAKGRLVRSMGDTISVGGDWRLVTDHADAGLTRFARFHLRSNANDAPFPGPLSLTKELRGAQPRALAWMRAQEIGVPLTITEVEEAVHRGLGWRAEARAHTTIEVRGGVLADLPSFGKTVTTIALVQSEFEELSPGEIMAQNRAVAEHQPQLIDTAATLVVCPPHITMQWQTEMQNFLGDEQYEDFDVRVIRDFAELKKLSVADVQQSRVVIVSWNVFSDDDYISELAWTTAMPEPANSSCRAFEAWMDGVSRDLPAQVMNLQTMDLSDFKHATHDLLKQRLGRPEFQATLPLKLQHGSNYQSYEAMRAANGARKSGKTKPAMKRKLSGSSSQIVPLLHMFSFNRIVVDEYHYLNDYKKIKNMFTAVGVKKFSAHKRWILSGTPALANFTDVDNIASFLGVRLGRFAVGASKRTALEDFLVGDQTIVERFLSKTEVMSRQWHQARHERAQNFLDLFVRQNEASLEHIPCHEELRALELDAAHHAIYLELSKHLISQRMQVKRLRNKAESDRTSRLNASLNNSKTAEDALLKAALVDNSGEGDMSLQSLIKKRSDQRREVEIEISTSMRAFEWHKSKGFKGLKPTDPKKAEKEENTVPKLYASFREDIKKNTWLGDGDAAMIARRLLKAAEGAPLMGGLVGLKEVSQEKRIKEAKTIMSRLRDSCTELVSQRRSERFIESVQQLLQALHKDIQDLVPCDADHCQKRATISDMYLASQCGHLTCKPCVMGRGDDENCVVAGCNCMVQAANLIKATDLGSTTETVRGPIFGRKMHSILKLIRKFPNVDQGLVFAPNDETIAMLGEALDHYSIPYYTPSGCNARQAAKIIEEFKESANEDPVDRPKVLLLNLASETAAGVNLTNANHIIFISPLLVESQYKYDSAMTQAIARSRRYGQEKQVYIYHFAALRTIDVDILEHRHKRTNGITAARSSIRMPSKPLTTREKTKLVKDKQGSMALVPISWLDEEKMRKRLGIGEELETFTSLINFSETFEDGDD